jgi:hypothetical protein
MLVGFVVFGVFCARFPPWEASLHSMLVAQRLQVAATVGNGCTTGDNFILLPKILLCWVFFFARTPAAPGTIVPSMTPPVGNLNPQVEENPLRKLAPVALTDF